MDIDLLSKMVKELILDNDRVVLPGLGSFVAEIVPATFSDKGYTINPPYRKLYFRSKPDEGSDLIPFYAKSNSVSEEIAEKIITDFVIELKAILFHKKTIIFPGLGRLRATKENNVFFVADEDLDIYPEGFGLEPISLKTHQATVAEVREAVTDLKSILTEPEVKPVVEVVDEVVPEPQTEVSEEPQMPEEAQVIEEQMMDPMEELVSEQEQEPETESEQPVVEVEVVVEEQQVVEESVEEMVEAEPVVSAEPVVEELPTVEFVEEPVVAPVKKSFWKIFLKVVMWLAIATMVLTVAYVAVAHLCPEWIDQFLYTPEELELLNNIH